MTDSKIRSAKKLLASALLPSDAASSRGVSVPISPATRFGEQLSGLINLMRNCDRMEQSNLSLVIPLGSGIGAACLLNIQVACLTTH